MEPSGCAVKNERNDSLVNGEAAPPPLFGWTAHQKLVCMRQPRGFSF
jgi:hypothetical protein